MEKKDSQNKMEKDRVSRLKSEFSTAFQTASIKF